MTGKAMNKAKYFQPSEFRRCTPPCSIDDMQPNFLTLLDAIRERAGIPLVLNSAYRSKEYENQKGRSGNSAHTYGLAVDIRCHGTNTRWKIVRAAVSLGVTRIGIGSTFVHIDTGESRGLPPNVIWTYDANGNAV